MVSDPNHDGRLRNAVTTALQSAMQGQWPAAVEAVRPLADEGDPLAVAMTAMYLGQSGQAAQGVQYAERAIEGDIAVGPLAANYMNWVQNDVNLRSLAPKFFQAALDAGWAIDPFGQAQAFVQQGNPDGAYQILLNAKKRTLPEIERAWEGLSKEIAQNRGRIDDDLRQVSEARAEASASMDADREAIRTERERVQELVAETASLVQNLAADNLASEYAARAKAANRRAGRWTIATLVVSVLAIAAAAAFVLIGLAYHHDVSTVLARAAITLPLLALAAYLNKLSTDERRDARNWTHIELQIRTARPYLGNLPEAMRDEVQAALALRFFPGQALDPHGSNGSVEDTGDALSTLRDLVSQTRSVG